MNILRRLKVTTVTKKKKEKKRNQSYHFLRGYFVLGTSNVLHLIFTPSLEDS